ncbi:MAG: PAS domain S-box protein [Candidatus Marinimicrobia bacterium]|nr:PAS domain S-box protein [Candidatus Neomarinimicrobiota bacterium]MCF7839513.1 PAS domain S-box protein [Candidatus Neomarinimicrobiota bacterium]
MLIARIARIFLTVKPFSHAVSEVNSLLQSSFRYAACELFIQARTRRYFIQPDWWHPERFNVHTQNKIPTKVVLKFLQGLPGNQLTMFTKSRDIEKVRDLLTADLIPQNAETILFYPAIADATPNGFMVFYFSRPLKTNETVHMRSLEACLEVCHAAMQQIYTYGDEISEELFRQLFQQTAEPMLILRRDTIIQCNAQAAEILGYPREFILDSNPGKLIQDERRPAKEMESEISALLDTAYEDGIQTIEYNYTRPDGKIINFHVSLTRIEIDGEYHLHVLLNDISALRHEQRELAHKAAHLEVLQAISTKLLSATNLLTVYRSVYEVINEIIPLMAFWVTLWNKRDDVFQTVYLNENGLEPDISDTVPLERNPKSKGHGLAAISGEPVLINDFPKHMQSVRKRVEIGSRKMAGSTLYVPLKKQSEVSGVVIFQHQEKNAFSQRDVDMLDSVCTQLATAMTNLTLVEQLASNEQRYRYLVSHMHDGFMMVDNNNFITMTNDRMAQMLGLPRAENLESESLFDFVDEINQKIIDEATARRRKGLSETYEFSLRHVSGRPIVVSASVSPLYDDDGKVMGAYGLFRDITQQRMDEKQHQIIYEISRAANFTDSIDDLYEEIYRIINRLIDARNFVLALYNRRKGTIRYPFFRDENDERPEGEYPVRGLIGYVIKSNRPLLVNRRGVQAIYRAEGVERIGTLPFYWIGIPMNIEDKVIGVLVVQTYDKKVIYTEQHRDVLSIIAGEIARVIERRRARRAIEASETRYRQIVDNAFEPIVTLNAQNVVVIWNQAAMRVFGYSAKEVEGQSLAPIFGDTRMEKIEAVLQKIAAGELAQGGQVLELIGKHKDGSAIEVGLSISMLTTDQGLQATVIMRDITLQKKADRELQEAHAMKEMMLDIISHDLKNPAATISGMSELIAREMPNEEPIQVIRMASDSLLEVIASAGSLAQLMTEGSLDSQDVNLTEIIESVAASFSVPLRAAGMTLELKLKKPVRVKANPIISEVFNNYISNAIKYSAGGKRIVITAESNKDQVTIAVKDFGKTIPEFERERIFQRNVQLGNKKKRGRGLGLAIVKRIADAHNASVGVQPNEPTGNRFYITLPAN